MKEWEETREEQKRRILEGQPGVSVGDRRLGALGLVNPLKHELLHGLPFISQDQILPPKGFVSFCLLDFSWVDLACYFRDGSTVSPQQVDHQAAKNSGKN